MGRARRAPEVVIATALLDRPALLDPPDLPARPAPAPALLEPRPEPPLEQPARGRMRPGRLRRAVDQRRMRAAGDGRQACFAEAAAALDAAAALLATGWVQNAWFHVQEPSGRARPVGPFDVARLADGPVSGVCLVGAVVQATGGVAQARSELTARTLDLVWDALQARLGRSEPSAAARAWAPAARTVRVRELTGWNDRSGRSPDQVLELVRAARARACDASAVR